MNHRFLCECYRQGSGSHEIASILLEIVLTIVLHLSMGKARKSRCVKRKRLNESSEWMNFTQASLKNLDFIVYVVKYSGL